MIVATPRVLHVSCAGGGGTDAILQEYPSAIPDVEHLFLLRPGVPVPRGADGERCWSAEVPDAPWAAAATLRRVVRQQRPHLVHAHSSWAGTLARSLLGRTPVIYTPHCFATERTDQRHLIGLSIAGAERLLARRTAGVVAVAPREAAIARALRSGLVVDVAYQCFRDRPPAGEPRPTENDQLDVVACGRLAPQKDPHSVAALKRAAGHLVRVTWIGGGDATAAAALAAVGVEVTGWLDPEQARSRLGAADVLVHTARWEGFPLVVLEAIALGVPVIALDAPYLCDTGLPGVQPDVAALRRTLATLTDVESRRALSARQGAWYDAIRASRPEATISARYRQVAGIEPGPCVPGASPT